MGRVNAYFLNRLRSTPTGSQRGRECSCMVNAHNLDLRFSALFLGGIERVSTFRYDRSRRILTSKVSFIVLAFVEFIDSVPAAVFEKRSLLQLGAMCVLAIPMLFLCEDVLDYNLGRDTRY